MELQTQQTQDLALQSQVPTTAIVGKEPIAKYLPNDLQMSLKQMAKAQISQSMLKYASDSEISQFAIRLINFINPKFEEGEAKIAEAEIYSFARNCELTANEFLLALELSADGKLYSEPDTNGNSEKIKLYREVDRLKLGEIKSAYIALKRADKVFQEDVKKIKAFLEPPKPEKTPEELQKERQERFNNLVKMVLENEGDFTDRKFSIASFFYDDFKDEFPELSKEEKERILISKQKAEILKERKREKKLHLNPSELKKADEILSSGKYLPKDHIIYHLALMEIKKELVIDFILSKFKAK